MIGEDGLTPSVLKEIDRSLNAHGLIKLRSAADSRDERDLLFQEICEQMAAAPVQHLGKILIVYRPNRRKPRARRTHGANRRGERSAATSAKEVTSDE